MHGKQFDINGVELQGTYTKNIVFLECFFLKKINIFKYYDQ